METIAHLPQQLQQFRNMLDVDSDSVYTRHMNRYDIDPDDARELRFEDEHDERYGAGRFLAPGEASRLQDEIAARYRAMLEAN